MTIAQIVRKMVNASRGNRHDIEHFMKVWAYAKTIGELEGLGEEEQATLEIAALVHDIACPLCREKYGSTDGKLQELEGGDLARAFLSDAALPSQTVDRVAFLVSHHHTPKEADGMDYQILLEADYLVNADESEYSPQNIRNAGNDLFRTQAGRALLRSVYGFKDAAR